MSCRHYLTAEARRIVVTLAEHVDPLPEDHDADCKGCLPCDRRHCIVCAGHLWLDEYGTCVVCIGDVRRDLTAVLDLVTMLPEHALQAARWGHLVAADPIPGGDAIVMLNRGSEGVSDDGKTNPGDPMPPSYLLGWWEQTWRDALGISTRWHPPLAWTTDAMPIWQRRAEHTLSQAYSFLNLNLNWAASNHAGFGVFASDVAGLRRHLEELLYAGERPAEGVACFKCGATLIRDYRDPRPCACPPRIRVHSLHRPDRSCLACRWETNHQHCDQGGLLASHPYEGWHCPRCRRTYSAGEYGLAAKATYDEHAPALPATELAKRLGVAPATIWSWAQRGHIRRRGRAPDRRTLYDVRDALKYVNQQKEAS